MRAKSLLSLTTLPFRNGYVFAICVMVVFMQAGFHSGRRDKSRLEDQLLLVTPEIQDQLLAKAKSPLDTLGVTRRRGVVDEHPIPKLMEQAEVRYRKKLAGQSKSLKAAVQQYKKRYGRPPPKGFDEWWAFARKNNVRMVDEYDGLMEDLEPFWGLSGVELKRRAAQASRLQWLNLYFAEGVYPGGRAALDRHRAGAEWEIRKRQPAGRGCQRTC